MLNLWLNGQVLDQDLNHSYQEKYNQSVHLPVYQKQNNKQQLRKCEYRIQ